MSNSIDNLNKPNELISIVSEKNISITQRRAYNIFLKTAQDKLKFDDYKGNVFQVPCSELYKASNIKNKNKEYVEEEEIDNLMTTLVKIRDKDNPSNWKAFNLLSYVDKKDDFFYFELNSFIIKSLKEQTFFTPLDLIMTNSLSSQYSVLFYELAIRYEKYKIPKMTIQEIRELTGTINEYSRTEALRRRVLDTACNEITEKTDIILKYDAIKSGQKITHIDFKITRKKDNILNPSHIKKTTLNAYDDSEIESLLKLCREKTENIRNIIIEGLKKYSFEIVKSNIEYSNIRAKDKFEKYLEGAVLLDWAKDEREKKKEIKVVQQKLIQEKQDEEVLRKAEVNKIYDTLSPNELKKYKSEYDSLPDRAKKTNPTLEIYIKSVLAMSL